MSQRNQFDRRFTGWSSIVLISLMVGVLLFMHTSRADATTYDWAKWEIDYGFESGSLIAEWTVIVGNGSGAVLNDTTTLSCTAHNGAYVADGLAHFDGVDDHFSCVVPSFAAKVMNITGGALDISGCTDCAFDNDYAMARASVRPISIGSGGITDKNPIVYHPDIIYSVPSPNFSEGRMLLESRGTFTKSALFDLDLFLKAHESGFVCTSSAVLCSVGHVLDGTSISTGLTGRPSEGLTMTPTTLFIGHDPVMGSFFRGPMGRGWIDPGCPADGN